MKLVRYATVYLQPSPARELQIADLNVDTVEVHLSPAGKDAHQTRFLIEAAVVLSERPEVADDGTIIVPTEPRRKAEDAIETTANLLAVTDHCRRSISSPYPFVALFSTLEADLEWLETTKGFQGSLLSIPGTKQTVPFDARSLQALQDRVDGVALLAEALAHNHPTGRFHEFIRLLERAFTLPPSQFEKKLTQFLQGASLGYERPEIKRWVDLRNPATHADELTPGHIVFESHVRPVIARMEQAAYDVLFNKKVWSDPSRERRNVWHPPVATCSERHHLRITHGEGATFIFQALDPFEAFLYDQNMNLPPMEKNPWAKWPESNPPQLK
jgi:hypothetical protein